MAYFPHPERCKEILDIVGDGEIPLSEIRKRMRASPMTTYRAVKSMTEDGILDSVPSRSGASQIISASFYQILDPEHRERIIEALERIGGEEMDTAEWRERIAVALERIADALEKGKKVEKK